MDWSPFTTATPTAKYTGLSGISIIYQHLWPVWWISHCSHCLDFKHFSFLYLSRSHVGDITQKPSSSSFVLYPSISFSNKHSHLLSMHQKFCNTIKRQSLKSVHNENVNISIHIVNLILMWFVLKIVRLNLDWLLWMCDMDSSVCVAWKSVKV